MKWDGKLLISFLICFLVIIFTKGYVGTSTAYAYWYDVTNNDMEILANYYFPNENTTNKENLIAKLQWARWRILEDANYDTFIINIQQYYAIITCFGVNSENIESIENLNNVNYMKLNLYNADYYKTEFSRSNNNWTSHNTTISNGTSLVLGSGAQLRSTYLMYNNDLGNITNGPYQTSEVLDFNKFRITLNTNNETQYINIETDTNNTINNIPILNTFNFGTLEDNTYIYYINDILGFWYWNGTEWTYKVLYNRNKEMVLLQNNNYMSFTYNNDNENCNFMINSIYQYYNVIYHYTITNAQFDSVSCYFLIGDGNTTITNNTLDTANLGTNYLNQFNNLDNIINNNNNTEQIIENDNKINKFWEDTYNRLMTPSGEVIKQTINELYEEINIFSGDTSGEIHNSLAGLEIIEGQSEDFKIRWQTMRTHFTLKNENIQQLEIPSGEINFSKLERENAPLHNTMVYTRAILSFAVISLFLKDLWFTLLKTFGVSTQVYERDQAEKQAIENQQKAQEEKWKSERDKQRYKEWLRSNRK